MPQQEDMNSKVLGSNPDAAKIICKTLLKCPLLVEFVYYVYFVCELLKVLNISCLVVADKPWI